MKCDIRENAWCSFTFSILNIYLNSQVIWMYNQNVNVFYVNNQKVSQVNVINSHFCHVQMQYEGRDLMSEYNLTIELNYEALGTTLTLVSD